jgi:hypothetical protein
VPPSRRNSDPAGAELPDPSGPPWLRAAVFFGPLAAAPPGGGSPSPRPARRQSPFPDLPSPRRPVPPATLRRGPPRELTAFPTPSGPLPARLQPSPPAA